MMIKNLIEGIKTALILGAIATIILGVSFGVVFSIYATYQCGWEGVLAGKNVVWLYSFGYCGVAP